jgi:HEPN domain-containing protein
MRPTPKDIIGFHCQQAVEKCLKAILVFNDIEPPRQHDLLYLNSSCRSHSELPSIDIHVLSRLNPYSVEHGYPGEISTDENDIACYLQSTTELVNELCT